MVVVVVNLLKHDEVLGEVLPTRCGTMTGVVTSDYLGN